MASGMGCQMRLLLLLVVVVGVLTSLSQADVVVSVGAEQHSFDSRQAAFGAAIPNHGISGILQLANPVDACLPLDPPRTNGSHIVLIQRGGANGNPACLFDEKVRNAEQSGFLSAIIYDNVDEDLLTMASEENDVGIASVFVSRSSGLVLKDLENNPVRLTPDPHLQWPSFIVSFAVITSAAFLIIAFVLFYRRCYTRRRQIATVVIDTSQIRKLPTRIAGPISTDPHNRDMCCICLEEHVEGDLLTVLPCKHAFHKRCIEPWLLQSHRTCPVCKRDPCPTECTPLMESV